MGFASFECGLPDASCSIRLEGEQALQPARLVKTARDACWASQFHYAPIDREAIRKLVEPVKSFDGMLDALPFVKPRSLKNELEGFAKTPEEYAGKGDFRDFAVSCYLYEKFAPAFDISVPREKTVFNGARLAADAGNWRIVKKALAGVKPEETLAGLVGIFNSSLKKLLELEGVQADALVKKQFKRKSFSSLKPFMESLPESSALARECLALKGFEASGAAPFVLVETINACYPQFKIPKPKGRLPKA
ncbi:hypothetical protein COX85_02570 [Candidatus Micrarchaeota archaeon CG_4_10_14_0_2_um_filter_55_9]|nr:MAG: hypothetical protein AUJ15_04240 [Candidatus Micrarchaeota archaeon CG1_02_55_41]PIO02867.1 MAG: hypothetical protein COT57_01815 [Candidatus Micrarchaeota archaeon CG09_land_8_20_14_0_10_55_25]PIZ91683.1 MAG: hypothetical protein COX85_02570 [Candidatus Micrarchaeota archaeon CG_4_10_14_0_2_um_filter_55_9]PJD01277.1 MAG: hypothetical protein COU38_01865 [Candidatus Micrarchaeota archaeon CG10_big_fil_rev_8_21_14_0_10_54_18]